MADFDVSFKIAAHNSGRELCRLAGLRCDAWEPIGDTLQTTERLADRAFRARQGDESFVVYFEAYTVWREDARWNILAKSALLSERERLPTRTLVFVLTPERYREQHGTFRLEVAGEPTQQVWYRENCLRRERPEPWWETVPGLMALYPLTAHDRPPADAIQYATQTIATRVTETSARADLLTALGIFGTLVYPALNVANLIGGQLMSESKFLQHFEDKAERKRARIAVQEALDVRFGAGVGDEFTETLNGIEDLEQLSELHRLAIKSRGLAAFRRALARLAAENSVRSRIGSHLGNCCHA
jgi:hypothetical protein